VTGAATDPTNDVRGKVPLVGAIPLSVTNLATVLTGLVLVVPKCAVELGKLAKLVPLVVVLSFWRRGSLLSKGDRDTR
jgi:hypothetical protein